MVPTRIKYHLPGLFEFYELYRVFLPLFYEHREYFYEWCEIGSIYGAPMDALWGGGRVGYGDNNSKEVFSLLKKYNISARLTFSNSQIHKEHLNDKKCNDLCAKLNDDTNNGVIVYSDLLLDYIKAKYPGLYFVSSTTKVITDWNNLVKELDRDDFRYVVPDFRFNNHFELLDKLSDSQKAKMEFLVNECCYVGCKARKQCYENVSLKAIGEEVVDHICQSPTASEGYVFSKAMESPAFIGIDDIKNVYRPKGFTEFKIEGRSLGSALVLEFLLYYMTKPEFQLKVREAIYLDHSLDLF